MTERTQEYRTLAGDSVLLFDKYVDRVVHFFDDMRRVCFHRGEFNRTNYTLKLPDRTLHYRLRNDRLLDLGSDIKRIIVR